MAPGNSVNVAVVGAGSIGSRHQRILERLGHKVSVVSANSPDAEFRSLAEALDKKSFDYVVIASQTSRHFDDFKTLIKNRFEGRVLIEKPLFATHHPLTSNNFQFSAVGYNLRFHPAVAWLKNNLPQLGAISSATFYVGKYLPTWRPNIDYKKSSSATDAIGAGVLRDLSHELDLAQNLFGDWQQLTALGGKFSDLEISTSDTFSILMQTVSCPVLSIQMNYLDRIDQRFVTVNGNNGTIKIDFVANIAQLNEDEVKFDVDADQTYIAQHQAIISSDSNDICSLTEALKVVTTIDAIEKSARQQQWVRL
ncbi:MAG: gfo/Idh/MocA family oxidoreductase [Acidimicrobiia bacterium]|nr:gfo/Idh/MocA family oxidoreductase [Acidimicrobiia bacterium]